MSQYPYPYPYGPYHGQQPQQGYHYPNAPHFPAPGYAPPNNPPAPAINRAASQASFDYNANRIPGLGLGPPPPPGRDPSDFGLGPSSWIQPPFFPTSVSHVPMPQPSTASSLLAKHSQANSASNGPRETTSLSNQPAPPPTRPPANADVEEGELSEGQFEDLYEPRESDKDAAKPVSKLMPVTNPSQPTSAADTPDGGFYGSDEGEGGNAPRDNEGRERSASYSPFLSPREIQSEVPTPQQASSSGDDPKIQSGSTPAVAGASTTAVPGLQLNAGSTANPSANDNPQRLETPAESKEDSFGPFKSLHEAKKEAQKAILRLWPLGVKYQNYIDEGFDEKLIKSLFRDLHLDMPKAADDHLAPPKDTPQSARGANSTVTKPGAPATAQAQPSGPPLKDSSVVSGQAGKGEERKDRIARLLAAKAAKTPAAAKPMPTAPQSKPATVEPQSQSAAPASSTATKTKAWGEKERLLQQKIAALQKSREAQAQKSAAEKNEQKDAQRSNDALASSSQMSRPAEAESITASTGPEAGPARASSAGLGPSIPGLLLSPNSKPSSSNHRKRPVASDFVDYASGPPGPAKRPFDPTHKQTSLIIDVSDGSDDEEMELDMDMSSPVETSPIQSSDNRTQGGPSIRDFPPLTDTFSPRQFSSPAPSLTPPSSSVNGTRRVSELESKEKAIQEMRRKIALAEARRKAKQSSGGSLTPNPAGWTPEPKESETFPPNGGERAESMGSPIQPDRPTSQPMLDGSLTTLPNSSETLDLDPLKRTERRSRIMSLDLAQVDPSLGEKLNRLKQLRDEEEKLEAEIRKSLAEKRLLTDELDQLDTGPDAGKQQANGLGPVNISGISDSHAENTSASSTPAISDESREAGDVSMEETGFPEEQTRRPSGPGRPSESEALAATTTGGTAFLQDSLSNVIEETSNEEGLGISAPKGRDPEQNADQPSQKGDMNVEMDPSNTANTLNALTTTQEPRALIERNSVASEGPGPAGPSNPDEDTPMEVEPKASEPEAAEAPPGVDTDDDTNAARQTSVPIPDQISGVAQPREALQEMENEPSGELHHEPASKPDRKLTPYRSPLRYFHAYRFHADYQNSVAGGLKSLTYSNRIDPHKEFCPFELSGEHCPPQCQFQHFSSIIPPDDQILLELGNPDDYKGEQKSRFIQGLRELLQKFKADRVKDFDTIARGIIDFRAQILEDKSKVLSLEGVTI